MKKLIEKFALYLLRKVGRVPDEADLEGGCGSRFRFNGESWIIYKWTTEHVKNMGAKLTLVAQKFDPEEWVI